MNFKVWLENRDILAKSEISEKGVHFKTGKPVTFNYIRNTEKSPNFGEKFGQHIEPAGRYMLHNTASADPKGKEHLKSIGWETGVIRFENPLVIELIADYDNANWTQSTYGEKGWKQRLFDYYGKKGLNLTKALRADGYDGIVTTSGYDTREIVDLTFGENDIKTEWQGNAGNVGELRFHKVGNRSYQAAGIRSKWYAQGMKKKQKKKQKKMEKK